MIDLVALARPSARTPLKHLVPGWFAIVLGWGGLALAWQRAVSLLGAPAQALAGAAASITLLLFLLLVGLSLLRARRYAQALADDLRHPVRHAFVAAVPISLLLLVTLALAWLGPTAPGLLALWRVGALAQFGVTLWVLSRWLHATPAAGAQAGLVPHAGVAQAQLGGSGPAVSWGAITPVLLIPLVGNVVVPLAGVQLGQAPWAAAQFGVGLLLWPVLLTLFMVRLGQAGALPDRLLPSLFILVAPPALSGSALMEFGAPVLLVWALWGMAIFTALWVGTRLARIADQPFGIAHWALGFPLAALAALTLRLAGLPEGAWLRVPALALLALVSLIVLGLSLATLRGLRAGTLLVAESAAVIPVKALHAAAG